MRHESTQGWKLDAELIRAEAGGCSGPRRSDAGPAELVVVSGSGAALVGDVWVEVEPGDRLAIDPGEPCAVRPADGGTIIAVLLRPAVGAVQAA